MLAIKIFGVRTITNTITNATTSTIALIAALYFRTSPTPLIPTNAISFGTANPDSNIVNYILDATSGMSVPPGSLIGVGCPDPNNNNIPFPLCNAANLPTYIMNIPEVELFNGVPSNLLPQRFKAVEVPANVPRIQYRSQVTIRRQFNI